MCVFETTSYSIARLVRSLFRESGLNHRAPKANVDRYSDEFNDNWAGLQCGDSIGDWIDDNSYISTRKISAPNSCLMGVVFVMIYCFVLFRLIFFLVDRFFRNFKYRTETGFPLLNASRM